MDILNLALSLLLAKPPARSLLKLFLRSRTSPSDSGRNRACLVSMIATFLYVQFIYIKRPVHSYDMMKKTDVDHKKSWGKTDEQKVAGHRANNCFDWTCRF